MVYPVGFSFHNVLVQSWLQKVVRFEEVTNFKISVAGYISEEDHGLPVGYILKAHLERFDDNMQQNYQK